MSSEQACEEKLFSLRMGMQEYMLNIRRDALIIRERLKIRKLNPDLAGNTDDVLADLAQRIMETCDELEEMRQTIDRVPASV